MNEEKLLKNCLDFVGLLELPEELDKKNKKLCLESINKVIKTDGSIAYVIVKINPNTMQRYFYKEFGEPCTISKTLAVYPYLFLPDNFIPKLKTKEDKLKYLADNAIEDIDLKNLTDEEIKNEILKISIKNFYQNSSINDLIQNAINKKNDKDDTLVTDVNKLISSESTKENEKTTEETLEETNNEENTNTEEDF